MKRLAVWLLLTGVACVISFGVGATVLTLVSALLPPFRFEDGDTMREFGPVALAYGSMGLTALVGAVLAWRRVYRSS